MYFAYKLHIFFFGKNVFCWVRPCRGSAESAALLALNLSTVPLLVSSFSAICARQDRSSQAADAVRFPEVLGDSVRVQCHKWWAAYSCSCLLPIVLLPFFSRWDFSFACMRSENCEHTFYSGQHHDGYFGEEEAASRNNLHRALQM